MESVQVSYRPVTYITVIKVTVSAWLKKYSDQKRRLLIYLSELKMGYSGRTSVL